MSVVGTIAAAATFVITGGNPQATMWAYQIGATTESLLFPPKGPDGPRLGELSVQVSSYGQSLPRSWGTTRRAGNIIWSTDLQEHAHEQGGKGGPTQTTFSYTVSFAISFGEGPISGIRRLWAGGKLIYDASVSNSGPTKDFTATSFTIYTGTETQAVDPTIQADKPNTPAYRGQCYVVFSDLQLEKFGNRIPFDLQAEVVVDGSFALPAPAVIGSGDDFGAMDPETGYLWATAQDVPTSGKTTVYVNDPVTKVALKSIELNFVAADIAYVGDGKFWVTSANNGTNIAILSASGMALVSTFDPNVPWPDRMIYGSVAKRVYVGITNSISTGVYSFDALTQQSYGLIPGTSGNGWVRQIIDLPEVASVAVVTYQSKVMIIDSSSQLVATYEGTDFTTGGTTRRIAWDSVRHRIIYTDSSYQSFCYVIDSDAGTITKTTLTPSAPNAIGDVIYHKGRDEFIARGGSNLFQISAATFAVGTTFAQGMSPGFLFEMNGVVDYVLGTPASSDNITRRFYITDRLTPSKVAVSTIVTDLSVDAGLTAGDIDVTDLTGVLSDGFLLARQGSARSAIEQLMMGYQFDAVESGAKVKFVRRGTKPATVIDADSLAVHEPGQDVPTALPLKRADEVELPRSITIKYMNLGADHQIGAQSAIRQTGRSVNDVTWELPVIMTDAHAKAVADAGLYSAWAARSTARWSTSLKFADKEPTDLVSIEGNLIRITKRTLRGNIIDFEGALDSGMVFAGGAAAGAAQSVAQTIGYRSKTAIELMDIPLLRDQDNDAGFYVAGSGYKGQAWDGCVIFKSSDGGGSWDEVATLTKAATAGAASTALGDFSQNVFDESNSVTVLLRSGTLSSITELAVLNGGNAALLGSEIIQFRTATLNADGSYTLSGLLRGRKGSATSGHVIGDRFVLLNTTSVFRVDMSTAEIGLERLYKAVSIGDTLASARTIKFTNTAVGLECLSGVHFGGGRDASWNLTINWVRRTRVGGEWRDYADAAIGEATESYEAEIWTSSFTTLKRTITGLSSPTTTYTQGDADFATAILAPLKTPVLTNPGAEAGNTSGWTVEQGSFGVRSASPAPYAGSWYFDGGTALFVVRQRVDLIALGWTAAELDSGTLGAQIAAQMAGFDGVNDPGSIGLRYLNSAQATLAEYYSPEYTTNQVWVARSFARPMPVGTRYVDLLLKGRRTSGTNNDAYFDDVSCITGTYSGLPSTLGVKVYQLSANVGRGFVLQGTV